MSIQSMIWSRRMPVSTILVQAERVLSQNVLDELLRNAVDSYSPQDKSILSIAMRSKLMSGGLHQHNHHIKIIQLIHKPSTLVWWYELLHASGLLSERCSRQNPLNAMKWLRTIVCPWCWNNTTLDADINVCASFCHLFLSASFNVHHRFRESACNEANFKILQETVEAENGLKLIKKFLLIYFSKHNAIFVSKCSEDMWFGKKCVQFLLWWLWFERIHPSLRSCSCLP